MVDAFRSMLDELMGKERDVPLSQRQNKALTFDDKDVCKYELVALCPNRLFRNTKSDLGSCGFEIHDDHLEWPNIKAQWDKLPQHEKDRHPYERDLLRYMEQLIRDTDAKIRKNKERADAESRPRPPKPDDQKKLDEMKARQAALVAQAAALGEAGDVDGSLAATQAAEAVGKQHDALLRTATEPERSMLVCDVCGIFINSTDNEQRRLEHLTGKQYLGFKKIRETYAELVKARDARPPPAAGDDEEGGERRRGSRSRSREAGGRSRSRSRDGRRSSRGGSRERGSHHRDRDRDFHHHHHRSDRDYRHRSGSYDRHRDYRDGRGDSYRRGGSGSGGGYSERDYGRRY